MPRNNESIFTLSASVPSIGVVDSTETKDLVVDDSSETMKDTLMI